MNVGVWLGAVVQAVQQANTSKLLACLDARNEDAQSCLHRAQFTPEQLRQVAHGKFANARVDDADNWASVAAEHLLALQLSRKGRHGVRCQQPPCHCGGTPGSSARDVTSLHAKSSPCV